MNVLVFTSLFPNSVTTLHGIFIQQRISALAARPDISLRVVAPVPFCPKWMTKSSWRHFADVPRHEQFSGLGVFHPRYPLLPRICMPLHGALMFSGAFRLVQDLNRQQPIDCIDAHYVYPDGFAAVLVGRALGIPVCVSARGSDVALFPTFRTIHPMIRWTINRADEAIAVSEALRRTMYEVADRPDIEVVGNGIDSGRFAPVCREEARDRLGMPRKGRVIVCVAALVPVKNHVRLLEAFSRIGSIPDPRLYLVGKGPLMHSLRALASELQLDGKVFFVGSVANQELKYWYSAADVTCLTSDREGWPNVLSESLACGTPVVTTDAGGSSEVISSRELGLVVNQSSDALAHALRTALLRVWNRDVIAAHARRRTWDVVAGEVESYLRRSVERRRRQVAGEFTNHAHVAR
jgi:teichuronic acid biosynthesis glycosyltransferase TuaC